MEEFKFDFIFICLETSGIVFYLFFSRTELIL